LNYLINQPCTKFPVCGSTVGEYYNEHESVSQHIISALAKSSLNSFLGVPIVYGMQTTLLETCRRRPLGFGTTCTGKRSASALKRKQCCSVTYFSLFLLFQQLRKVCSLGSFDERRLHKHTSKSLNTERRFFASNHTRRGGLNNVSL
jgi:hypothetical protein